MSDTTTKKEKEAQTQHVLAVASSNLSLVIDQLESLQDQRVDAVLEALDTAKTDLSKLVKT